MNAPITVVIPSYNRGHLLADVLQSYHTSQLVREVIVVNDASTDNTKDVLDALLFSFPKLKVIHLSFNRKQHHCKNVGIAFAQTPLIYFGDDDSFLVEGTLENLYSAYTDAALGGREVIVGAKAIYLDSIEERAEISQSILRRNVRITPKIDWPNLIFDFSCGRSGVHEVSLLPACFLCTTRLAKQVLFREIYTGNCIREESDFIMECRRLGVKLFFVADAVQVNLPRILAPGGSSAGGRISYEWHAFWNNWRFLKLHWEFVKKQEKLSGGIISLQLTFVLQRFKVRAKSVLSLLSRKLFGANR